MGDVGLRSEDEDHPKALKPQAGSTTLTERKEEIDIVPLPMSFKTNYEVASKTDCSCKIKYMNFNTHEQVVSSHNISY